MIAGGARYILYRSETDPIRLYALADIHLGNRGVAMGRFQADVDLIRDDPCAFWIGLGDYCDLIGMKDKRFDPEAIAEHTTVRDLGRLGRTQMKEVREIFRPIEHKCVGVMKGNHEDAYEIKNEDQQLVHWLATEMNTRYLGYCCFLDIILARVSTLRKGEARLVPLGEHVSTKNANCWRVRVFAHHGSGYAQTPGGKLNKLIQFMDYFDADLTIVAHIHDQNAKRLVRLRANRQCTKLLETPQVGMVTGTYMRTYAQGEAGYGEKKGYRPVPLGAVAALFHPRQNGQNELRVEI